MLISYGHPVPDPGARMRSVARIYVERHDMPDEFRQLFDALATQQPSTAAECTPPVDVLETPAGLEVLVDVPGVPADGVQVVFSRNVLLVAGEKLPSAPGARPSGYHLAERGFGRFVRTIRLEGAYDAGRATASLESGELRVVLPRIEERRGQQIRIAIR